MHKTLKDWRAKRAGGRITVYGNDVETGEAIKLVGVDQIMPRADGKVAATDKDGHSHTLLVA